MAILQDRRKKEVTPTAAAILNITGKNETKSEPKKKYPVNVVFDGEMEDAIRERAKERGLGVATYIKTLVMQDLREE